MNFWDKVVGYFSAEENFKRTRYRTAATMLRKYEGAAHGRRTNGWKASSTSALAEVEGSLTTLRNRSRQLVRDNAYASKGLQAITANTVGWGILGQVKITVGQKNKSGVNKLAVERSTELSNVWRSWANSKHCDFDQRHNFAGLQRLAMRSLVESGEVLIRRRRITRKKVIGEDGYEVEIPPLALQILESDFIASDRSYTVKAADGNYVVQGIEFDKDDRRVAYHLFQEHPGNGFALVGSSIKSAFSTVRVPAEEIIHMYRADRPGQIRGVPWLAPVMLRLRDFDEYEDAQLVRQKIAAMFAVFIKDLDGVDSALAGGESEMGEKVEPGIIEILPPGKDITLANPPGVQGYGEYSAVTLHAISAGLGITYESMTGDMSQVNFSSARMGHLEMSRNIEEWREDLMLGQFLNPAFDWWRQSAELIGLDTNRARIFWTPPRREMVDPSKEVTGIREQVRAGIMTQSEAIRNNGYDPEKFFEEMATDNATLDRLKLVLDTDPRNDPKRLLALAKDAAAGVDEPAPQP